MQPLREYQISAIAGVHTKWNEGHRRVCLVCPTGGGKTRLAEELIFEERQASGTVLFVVHRRELLRQAADRLRLRFGHLDVGIIAPGESLDLAAPIQVATVQTLLARNFWPPATLIVLDEHHHYVAADWSKLATHYPSARVVGLTATPERQDGKPLGDIADAMVVAASYTQLIRDGFLVPCRVYQPPDAMAGSSLARDPLDAYQRYGANSRTFVFCHSVEAAYELAKRFREAGIPAATIEAKTKKNERDASLESFADGSIQVLTNCYALTEGVDVPQARCVILARACAHVGGYLQMAGRVLRPAPGKTDAILIDLTGATLQHGLPTEDREYSLDGDGIRRTSPAPLRNCANCGATIPAWQRKCPECGYEAPAEERPEPKIYSLELREVYAGADTPSDAKGREYRRLRDVAREKGWSIGWVVREYRRLFNAAPELKDVPLDERRAEFLRLREVAKSKGYKPGFVLVRYRDLFGSWPPREWRNSA